MTLRQAEFGKEDKKHFRFKDFWFQRLPLSQQVVDIVSRNKRTRKEKSIQWESFDNWTWYINTICFFNLWKHGEGKPYFLFKIIRFIVEETWFTKINNHELDSNKKYFVSWTVCRRLQSLRVMLLFLNLFLEFKDMHNSFCELI